MGTNYYVRHEACRECGRCAEDIHIGKSSMGWKFLFAPLERRDDDGIYSWKQWREYLVGKKIVDEHGRGISLPAFIDLVESKQNDGLCALTASRQQYGPYSLEERARHENKDDDGYRFSTTADFT
jgi:hypothetical protein